MLTKTKYLEVVVVLAIPFLFLLQSTFGFLVIFGLLVLCVAVNFKKSFSSNILLVVFIFTLSVFPVLLIFQHGLSHVFYYLMTVFSILTAKIISELKLKQLLYLFSFIFWFFVAFSLVGYYLNRDLVEPFSGLVDGSSTNGIPSYLIVLQIIYSLVYYSVNKRLPVTAVFFTIIIAVLGIGRGSIYTSVLILFLTLTFNFYIDLKAKRYKLVIYFLLLCFSVLLFLAINVDMFFLYLESRTKALQGLSDPYRNRILYEYISLIEWWQVLLGGQYKGTVISSLYDGNPHISFVRSHAYLGLLYTLLIAFSPLLFIFYTRKFIDSFIFLTLTSVLVLRSLSEPILFPTALDIFYYLIFFVYFKYFYYSKMHWT